MRLLVHPGVRQQFTGALTEPGSLAFVRDERREPVPEPQRHRGGRVALVPLIALLLDRRLHGYIDLTVERDELGLDRADGVLVDDLGGRGGVVHRGSVSVGVRAIRAVRVLRRLTRGEPTLLRPPVARVYLAEHHRASVLGVPLVGEPAGSSAQRVERGVALLHGALGARALLVA